MITLGLTGSIGMGKSTIAAMFAEAGVPVWDADAAVHQIYAHSKVVKAELAQAFGDVITDGVVDRIKLSNALKTAPHGFERLNAIVHPATILDRQRFLQHHANAKLVLVDIPLLYETGADAYLDKVLVVSAPPAIQRARVLSRPHMTVEKFEAILSRQTPDAEKRHRADFLIDTSESLDACRARVLGLIAELSA